MIWKAKQRQVPIGAELLPLTNGSQVVSAVSGNQVPCWTPPHITLTSVTPCTCLQMALKWADLGHLASPLEVHLKWVQRLEEEMFRQGDQERLHELPVSPLMDRHSRQGITKSQTGVGSMQHLRV